MKAGSLVKIKIHDHKVHLRQGDGIDLRKYISRPEFGIDDIGLVLKTKNTSVFVITSSENMGWVYLHEIKNA